MNIKDFNKFIESCFLLGIEPTWENLNVYKNNLKKLGTSNRVKTLKTA